MNIEKIWQAYQSSLKAFLLKNVANPADVDDLLQEILIKSYQRIDQLKKSKKVKSWLFQIAHHTIIDFYRQRASQQAMPAQADWYVQPEDEPALLSQLSDCILPFIKELPENDAKLLTAIEIQGVPQKQFARDNNINYSTLKLRVQKSHQQLMQLFSHCCEFKIDKKGHLIDFQGKKNNCTP